MAAKATRSSASVRRATPRPRSLVADQAEPRLLDVVKARAAPPARGDLRRCRCHGAGLLAWSGSSGRVPPVTGRSGSLPAAFSHSQATIRRLAAASCRPAAKAVASCAQAGCVEDAVGAGLRRSISGGSRPGSTPRRRWTAAIRASRSRRRWLRLAHQIASAAASSLGQRLGERAVRQRHRQDLQRPAERSWRGRVPLRSTCSRASGDQLGCGCARRSSRNAAPRRPRAGNGAAARRTGRGWS